MQYCTEKWGGRPHYGGLVHVLGTDEHGTWLWGPAGRSIWRGTDPLFRTEQDALMLIVPGAWWSPSWWIGHPDISVYVNIGTPPILQADLISSTDLDLDVVRFNDGRVEIVDRDEFELHQGLFGYPAEVIDSTERAAQEVLDLVVARTPPFDEVSAQEWIRTARADRLAPLPDDEPS